MNIVSSLNTVVKINIKEWFGRYLLDLHVMMCLASTNNSFYYFHPPKWLPSFH